MVLTRIRTRTWKEAYCELYSSQHHVLRNIGFLEALGNHREHVLLLSVLHNRQLTSLIFSFHISFLVALAATSCSWIANTLLSVTTVKLLSSIHLNDAFRLASGASAFRHTAPCTLFASHLSPCFLCWIFLILLNANFPEASLPYTSTWFSLSRSSSSISNSSNSISTSNISSRSSSISSNDISSSSSSSSGGSSSSGSSSSSSSSSISSSISSSNSGSKSCSSSSSSSSSRSGSSNSCSIWSRCNEVAAEFCYSLWACQLNWYMIKDTYMNYFFQICKW